MPSFKLRFAGLATTHVSHLTVGEKLCGSQRAGSESKSEIRGLASKNREIGSSCHTRHPCRAYLC